MKHMKDSAGSKDDCRHLSDYGHATELDIISSVWGGIILSTNERNFVGVYEPALRSVTWGRVGR